MANYAVTDKTTKIGSLKDVAAEMEIYMETLDTAKTMYLIDIKSVGASFQGVMIHLA